MRNARRSCEQRMRLSDDTWSGCCEENECYLRQNSRCYWTEGRSARRQLRTDVPHQRRRCDSSEKIPLLPLCPRMRLAQLVMDTMGCGDDEPPAFALDDEAAPSLSDFDYREFCLILIEHGPALLSGS